jgi:acetolactate synthase-1/2/3 large subunit
LKNLLKIFQRFSLLLKKHSKGFDVKKFSDLIADWLHEEGYTTVFFVAGGNIMHLIDSFSQRFHMVPVIHEVGAVIASDYFNQASGATGARSIALVTLGPGVTNAITGIAGAFVDSRPLVVLAGQVKTTDLKERSQRQFGIQEIDGVSITSSITKESLKITDSISRSEFLHLIRLSEQDRPGPVFIEICLDVQGLKVMMNEDFGGYNVNSASASASTERDCESAIEIVNTLLAESSRPMFLVGGGVSRTDMSLFMQHFERLGVPVATTWHATDRFPYDHKLYAGRPNQFGPRWANFTIQHSDMIVVLGSSLGLQQTGFNRKNFAPQARIIHIDIDEGVLAQVSDLPKQLPIKLDLRRYGLKFLESLNSLGDQFGDWAQWVKLVQDQFPEVESETEMSSEHVNPYSFMRELSAQLPQDLAIVSCSSGATYTTFMQVFQNKAEQLIFSSRGLGSMGYGLSGSIGACMASNRITILFEGDGGFAQNMQELGVVAAQNLPIKILVFNNRGYGSIRGTQKRHMGGRYVGCDDATGLILPRLQELAATFGIPYHSFVPKAGARSILSFLATRTPLNVEVPVHPEQMYSPRIESFMDENGMMRSSPLHEMSPPRIATTLSLQAQLP